MHEHLAGFTTEEGVLFIGRAQEKTALFRTEKRRDTHGDSYPWIMKTTGLVEPILLLVRHEAPVVSLIQLGGDLREHSWV